MAMRVCPQCQSDRLVKNGSAAGKPKKLCQQCGYQFTRIITKINAVLLDLSGMSMHRIAFLVRASAQSVLNWIRAFATAYYEKSEPTGRTIVLELDDGFLSSNAHGSRPSVDVDDDRLRGAPKSPGTARV
jgi:transposase-like protein